MNQDRSGAPAFIAQSFVGLLLGLSLSACGDQARWAAQSAHVETLNLDRELISLGGIGGVSVLNDGRIILSNFNKHVWRVTPAGAVTLVTDEMSLASGNTVLSDGRILQADFGQDAILILSPDSGVEGVFADAGLDGPVGMDQTADGHVLAANFEGGFIAKVPSAGGAAEVFATHEKMQNPNGIIIAPDGFAYVADLRSPIIFKVSPTGSVQEFATLPGDANGHITIANDALYVTQLLKHQIIRLEWDGSYGVVAGTGDAGSNDGPTGTSTLKHPNGIAADPTSDLIYFNGHRGVMRGGEQGTIAIRRLTNLGAAANKQGQ